MGGLCKIGPIGCSISLFLASLAEKFVGRWKLVESENFDEYMQAVGVGSTVRQSATPAKPTLTISVDANGRWRYHSESAFKTFDQYWTLDKEEETETLIGRRVMSTVTLYQNGTLTEQQRKINADDADSTIVRYVDDNNRLVMELEAAGVKAKRVYERADDHGNVWLIISSHTTFVE